jgi:hypothetical protein
MTLQCIHADGRQIHPLAVLFLAASTMLAVAACGDHGEPHVQLNKEELRAMLLTAEDLPAGFAAGPIHSVLPVEGPLPPSNFRVQLESTQPPSGPGDIGCVSLYVAPLPSPGEASQAVEEWAAQAGLASDVPGTTERLDPPRIGDKTAAVFVESPVYGVGRCGSRDTTGVTTVTFSCGPVCVSVSVFTAEGKPPSDEVWEVARKQLKRVEEVLEDAK